MSYCTPYCPQSHASMGWSPAELEDTDWVGVQALVDEFSISEDKAINLIEGMGYEMACEELGGEA